MKFIISAFLIITLTACSGWHLRGSDNTTLQTNSVFLSGQSGSVYSLVLEQLKKKNALSSSPSSGITLLLKNEEIKRRTASVTSSAVTAEYELTLTIDYEMLDATQTKLRPASTVRIIRSYTFDQNDVAGKDKEEIILRKEMQRAAARQLLQQVQLLQRKN